MLNSIFLIFLFQLLGELIQKILELSIPGPVIGLVLLLITLITIEMQYDYCYFKAFILNDSFVCRVHDFMQKSNSFKESLITWK